MKHRIPVRHPSSSAAAAVGGFGQGTPGGTRTLQRPLLRGPRPQPGWHQPHRPAVARLLAALQSLRLKPSLLLTSAVLPKLKAAMLGSFPAILCATGSGTATCCHADTSSLAKADNRQVAAFQLLACPKLLDLIEWKQCSFTCMIASFFTPAVAGALAQIATSSVPGHDILSACDINV